ncbi:MAG: GTP-binding protein [Opitutia bacterium]|nr:GxxExxY protein [Opitutaceae bacterium]PHX86949.1 MAG: GTP-binding protein [Opitutae bacterium]
MDTDKHGFNLPEGELTHAIIGAAFEVLNELGHGLHEKPYENALVVELGLREISIQQQLRFPVLYKGVQVGEYVPDLVVGSSVIVDTKVVERIADVERGKMMNYLRITKLRVGLSINFHRPKLEWERIAL